MIKSSVCLSRKDLLIIYGVSVIQAVNEKHETRFICDELRYITATSTYLKQMRNIIYLMMAAHWVISSDPKMHRSFSRFILSSGEENKSTSGLFSMYSNRASQQTQHSGFKLNRTRWFPSLLGCYMIGEKCSAGLSDWSKRVSIKMDWSSHELICGCS